jgi:hypothetical protein
VQGVFLDSEYGAGYGGHLRIAGIFDSSVESPISALRRISKSLRRKVVRLTPRDLRALNLTFLRNCLVFDAIATG